MVPPTGGGGRIFLRSGKFGAGKYGLERGEGVDVGEKMSAGGKVTDGVTPVLLL